MSDTATPTLAPLPQPSATPDAAPVAPPSQLRRWGKIATVLTSFAIGLFGTAALIRPRLPFPPIAGVRDKLAWFAAHGEEFDTLFVGSSRIFRQIIPAEFDRVMAKAGVPTHSFNLAMDAMSSPEDEYMLEKALQNRKKPLKFVISECYRIRHTYFENGMEGTIRHAYWHDAKRMGQISASIWGPVVADRRRESLRDPSCFWNKGVRVFGTHFKLFLDYSVNVGRGMELFKPEQPLCMYFMGDRLDG